MDEDKVRDSAHQWRITSEALTIPITFGMSPVVGWAMGYFLGKWLGIPWLWIPGLVLGFLAGIRQTVLSIRRLTRMQEAERKRKESEDSKR